MVHRVTTFSFTELKKFPYNTFTGNPTNLQPNVLSIRPMCKLLLLLLSSSSFTNAVQITVSTTNVIKGTQPQLYCVTRQTPTVTSQTPPPFITSLHPLTLSVPRKRQKHNSPYDWQWRRRREVKVQLYSFFDYGARWRWFVNTTPRPLYPRERPSTHLTGGWVGLGAGLNS